MTGHRNREHFENRHEHERREGRHVDLPLAEFHGVGHERHEKSRIESARMVEHGHLPQLHLGSAPVGQILTNGAVKFDNLRGCRSDTDGTTASAHKEDNYKQSTTSLTVNGRHLNADKDSYVALPPSVMKEYHLKPGDRGMLTRADTHQSVPVVFGDVSHEEHWARREPEASVAALRRLGFADVTGNNGVDTNVNFELTMAPGSHRKSVDGSMT